MIERTESRREREICEATCDGAATLCDLVGVGKVKMDAVREAGRTQGEFPSWVGAWETVMGKKMLDAPDIVVVRKLVTLVPGKCRRRGPTRGKGW